MEKKSERKKENKDHLSKAEESSALRNEEDLDKAVLLNIPNQEIGINYGYNEDGVIVASLPTYVDLNVGNTETLRALHPLLKEVTDYLCLRLAEGNSPHAALLEKI